LPEVQEGFLGGQGSGEILREEEMTKAATRLRVWHIPQVPMKPFIVEVESPEEAKRILDILHKYDRFQFKNNVKPDYTSSSGLEEWLDGEWCEWYDDEGNDITERE
jgi:hypothetical protein